MPGPRITKLCRLIRALVCYLEPPCTMKHAPSASASLPSLGGHQATQISESSGTPAPGHYSYTLARRPYVSIAHIDESSSLSAFASLPLCLMSASAQSALANPMADNLSASFCHRN